MSAPLIYPSAGATLSQCTGPLTLLDYQTPSSGCI